MLIGMKELNIKLFWDVMLCYVVEYVVPSVLKDHMAFKFFVLLHQEDKGHYML
jgi:hypothetical protein